MIIFFLVALMALNFFISWMNAKNVGKMWSEAKALGGSVRVLSVAVYVMAIIGFTMVYGNILLLVAPFIIEAIPSMKDFPVDQLVEISGDMLYVMIAVTIIPSGLIIWYNSVLRFLKQKSFGSGLSAAYNTYAQIRNTVNVARTMPSVLKRLTSALTGGKGKKNSGAVVVLALIIVIFAVCGGWFTASAILRKADKEYDGFEGLGMTGSDAVPPENEPGTSRFGE